MIKQILKILLFLGFIEVAARTKEIPLSALLGESSLIFLFFGLFYSGITLGWSRFKEGILNLDEKISSYIFQKSACFLGISALLNAMQSYAAPNTEGFRTELALSVGTPLFYILVLWGLLGPHQPRKAL